MTPRKAAALRKAAWTKALSEGRVVRWDELTLTSYPSIAARDAALAKAAEGDVFGQVVVVPA